LDRLRGDKRFEAEDLEQKLFDVVYNREPKRSPGDFA
jgi:hypothetical protein